MKFSSVCSYVCSDQYMYVITFMELATKFLIKVTQVVYISATAYLKAFIPWRAGIVL